MYMLPTTIYCNGTDNYTTEGELSTEWTKAATTIAHVNGSVECTRQILSTLRIKEGSSKTKAR